MNSTPSAPYPPPSPGLPGQAFPMSQLGVAQPGMSHPKMLQPEMSSAGVPSYEISAPKSDVPKDGLSSPNMICPPGLEYLIALDHLRIQQQHEILEIVTEWQTENKYHVMRSNGQPLYYITEESNTCARLCLGSSRYCEFRVFDINQREVLHMIRPYRCSGCCCCCYCCCMQELQVYSKGMLLGTVIENCRSFFRPSFSIRDASEKTVLRIKGPWCKCCGTVKFKIRSADNVHKVGEIKKEWGGFTTEIFTDADNFSLRFPLDLDVKIKAVLLGATILIDFLYFEQNDKHPCTECSECCSSCLECFSMCLECLVWLD